VSDPSPQKHPHKSETVALFQQRMLQALDEARMSRSKLAGVAGLDRSTLTQLLATDTVRLPRADTVVSIARALQVSADWLLGLSTEMRAGANVLDVTPQVALRPEVPAPSDEHLAAWFTEATGYKIRHVPSGLPDLAKTEALLLFEYRSEASKTPDQAIAASQRNLAYMRLPETDMEVCMERQQLEVFAAGVGLWTGLSAQLRREQLVYMATLIEDLYPGLRVYGYDGNVRYSAPYTVFGPKRLALYVGAMYLVFTSTTQIRLLTRHFDGLIRDASIQAHDMAEYLRSLAAGVK
jgi:transcriptional regulator with XRE-family HTH domain